MITSINEREFERFRTLIYETAGISLSSSKKALVAGRLGRRLRHHELNTFAEYYDLVRGGKYPDEHQIMVDLITTNETYFFREPRHFDFLREHILPHHRGPGPFRVWSAACSSGEEPYTLAMVLADVLGYGGWEITATDISTRVLQAARSGIYPMEDAEKIRKDYLGRFCLKGVRSQAGNFVIERRLREAIEFRQINLNGESWPDFKPFHVVFLRNVMIYFDQPTKVRLVEKIARNMVAGGYLIIGHSESLNGVSNRFTTLRPSIYQLR